MLECVDDIDCGLLGRRQLGCSLFHEILVSRNTYKWHRICASTRDPKYRRSVGWRRYLSNSGSLEVHSKPYGLKKGLKQRATRGFGSRLLAGLSAAHS
jgi:hypothetical protein